MNGTSCGTEDKIIGETVVSGDFCENKCNMDNDDVQVDGRIELMTVKQENFEQDSFEECNSQSAGLFGNRLRSIFIRKTTSDRVSTYKQNWDILAYVNY